VHVVAANAIVVTDVAPRIVGIDWNDELPSEWELSLLGRSLDKLERRHVQVSSDGEVTEVRGFEAGAHIIKLRLANKPKEHVDVAFISSSGVMLSQSVRVRAVPVPWLNPQLLNIYDGEPLVFNGKGLFDQLDLKCISRA